MKCPNCGNELDPNEVFCGQCGAPGRPTSLPTEMVQTPPVRSGQLNSPYNTQPGTGSFNAGTPSTSLPPNSNQSTMRSSGPQQQGEFYQDATESMSVLPNQRPGYPAGYPQQGYSGIPAPGASQFGQPMQTTNFAPPGPPSFPQAPIYQTGQAYGSGLGMTPPPKRNNNVVLVIAIICLACAIIAVSSFGILYLVHKNNAKVVATPTVTATTAPSPSPTPSLTPSPSPTPSPTMTPSPTVTPTATPDNGFSFCDTPCITNGFQVESPNGWQQTTPASTSIEFNDPLPTDVYAIFKTPGATTSDAITLIKNELTTTYPSATAPTSTSSMNIGQESWTYETASYQLNGATEQVQIYATVHGGKAFIIDLQGSASQFATFYNGFFQPMLNSFTFQ